MIAKYIWLGWIIYFLIFEGIALFNKTTGDTFSEQVWAWLKGKQQANPTMLRHHESDMFAYAAIPPEPIKTMSINHNTWRAYVAGAFLIWLFFHLTFGWFS